MIPPTYKPKKKFMQLAIAEAKRARDRGDYAIGAVITQLMEIGKWSSHLPATGSKLLVHPSSTWSLKH